MTEHRLTDLRDLMEATAHAHHAVYGGPDERWPRWYAEWMYGQLLDLLDSDPSLNQVEQWLRDADARYTAEQLHDTWPGRYAAWFADWHAEAAGA